ncbi:methionine gamma-lyase [Hyphobacterium sp. HN65]|uniref:L-methionine gamma-lyase n=1 Tax=Hyphobacterium lacteum TaxID=3116575 RepID=A0ABU7LPC6_9PROT|nr:methionine gamma-lyase [Hyphobacterium sp. HN65]MEE2525776.1 methionine gamma-lyase [Hyphobacterium sp. HN65]
MDGSGKITHEKGFSTRAIHEGYSPRDEHGALTPPLHMASTFTFDTVEDAGAAFAGEKPAHIYSRISNPTLDLLEKRMASLEGAEAAVAFGSGMGAITAVLWSLVEPGDEVLVDKTLYGCTFSFLNHGLAKFGVKISDVDMTDMDALDAALQSRPRIVYFESVANPNMRVMDIAAITAKARSAGALSIVDNTYCSPYLTQPVLLGADIVVHSATKYLGGHGDLIAGIACGTQEIMDQVRLYGLKDMTGAALSPFNAMLILRGLKTLGLRMREHSANAGIVARFLEARPDVSWIAWPGLDSFPQRELAARQMRLPGGMIAFEISGGKEAAIRFMNQLQMIQRAVSLGDAETLIQHPASMTHSTYTPEEQEEHGITPGLIRLSVGLEDSEDILADLAQALSA